MMLSELPICSTQSCQSPGVRNRGCSVCKIDLMTCSEHLISTFHKCFSVLGHTAANTRRETEIATLLPQINISALLQVASTLNKNIPCTAQPGSTSMMGCDNYHIHILFPSSGERWVVRVPNTGHSSFPGIDVEYLYASEFATLRFLESTKVPAPKVFGYDVKSNPLNDVGVTYLMMEFLEGKPFDVMAAGEKVKKRALEGWADVLIELSRHPVGKACSLMPPRVQNCSNDGKTHQREDRIAMLRTKVTQPFGPFATAKEYYAGVVDIVLESAASGKIWSNFAVEAYLVYLEVRSNISTLLDNTNLGLETDGDAELFYLTHIDAKGDHIMLSPSGSVAAIIDWQGARFVPFREAFGPSLLTTDMHALYFGRPGISEDDRLLAQILREKGASDLADAMLAGDLIRRLHFGLGSAKSKDEMWDFVRGLLEALGVYGGESLESWRENALGKYGDDVGLERVFHGSARSFR